MTNFWEMILIVSMRNIKMKKISLDFDNVLFDLESLNIKTVKEIYGVNMTAIDIDNWDFYQNNYPLIMNIWGDWNLYSKGSFFDGDQDFVQTLKKQFEVQIVTASYETIEKQKDEMIYNRYGDIKIIHTRTGKAPYTKDSILVDDGLHNVTDHININRMPAILVDRQYGWNQNYIHALATRASDYDSILRQINSFSTLFKVARNFK